MLVLCPVAPGYVIACGDIPGRIITRVAKGRPGTSYCAQEVICFLEMSSGHIVARKTASGVVLPARVRHEPGAVCLIACAIGRHQARQRRCHASNCCKTSHENNNKTNSCVDRSTHSAPRPRGVQSRPTQEGEDKQAHHEGAGMTYIGVI